ncbi:hypothetical protein BDW59DRAFT_151932 [Aspergillus cavernicola]|uniref:Uncharacterized protein n=1 Tax=Aspergillus cavernicola TaxID=176166 RepID=A0ABR4HTD3_9EURO
MLPRVTSRLTSLFPAQSAHSSTPSMTLTSRVDSRSRATPRSPTSTKRKKQRSGQASARVMGFEAAGQQNYPRRTSSPVCLGSPTEPCRRLHSVCPRPNPPQPFGSGR